MADVPSASNEMREAATVVLLRDSADGLEVLLLERPRHRGAFAGAWVFPGGSVDPGDRPVKPVPDEEAAARRAAIREMHEETGLALQPDALVLAAQWTPPVIAPRRFRTWFYLAAAPAGEIVLSPEESVGYAWLRPEAALERHAAGALLLVPPTWVTLHGLVGIPSVAEALDPARHVTRLDYATRVVTSEGGMVMLWQGDVAYEDNALIDQAGARHRLDARELPWVYSRSRDPDAG